MAAPDIGIRLSLDGAQQVEADLKRVSTGMQGVGVSAAQTAAAMRQVPAQVTDIVVSLQSGQAPLTVLLQQGGQLKDSFGGIGNAVKGVSSYLSGLVTSLGPVGIALTAVGGGAVLAATAMIQGAKEAEAYNRALIMTGNAAGVTVGQLQAQAKAVANLSGVTQGAAADALAQAAASGKVGAESLGIVTEAAVKLEKVGVQAVNKTIDQFAELGKSPVEASIKLNEQYNFLTASVFKQIKALEDQGKASEAAEVAQRALGEALSSRASQLSQNLGTLEKAWGGISGAAKSAWDAMLGLGRETTVEDKIATLQQQIADRQARNAGLGIKDGAATRELQAQLAALQGIAYAQQAGAKATAEQNDAQKAAVAWIEEGNKYRTKGQQLEAELLKLRNQAAAALKDETLSAKQQADIRTQLVEREKFVRDKYNESTGQSEVASIKAKTLAQQQYLDILKTQGLEAQKMTEGEKLVIQIKQQLTTSLTGVQRAEKLRALAAAEALAVVDKQVQGEERRLEGIKKSKEAYDQMVDATRKSADQLRTQADELEASNSMWGKGKVAIEQYRLALLEAKAAEVDQNPDSYRSDYIAALQEKIAQQRRIVIGTQTAEYKALLDKQNEWLRSAQEEAQLYQDEIGLLGLTTREREKVVAVRQVELKLAKEIAAINKSGATSEQKADAIAQAQAAAEIAKQTAAARADMNALTDIINSVDRTAQQVWTNIWQGGSDVFTRLGQTIKASILDLLYQLTIKKWVISITANILGSLGLGDVGSIVSGGSGGLNLLGTAGSAMSGANIVGSMYANATGTGIDGLLAANGAYGTAGATSALSSVAAAAPYVAAAYAAYRILSSLNGGETRTGGQYAVAYDGKVNNNRRGETYYYDDQYFQRPGTQKNKVVNGTAYRIEADGMGTQEDAIRTAVSSTANNIQAMLKALGSTATLNGFWAGLETSGNGRGGVFSGGSFTNGKTFGESGKGDNYAGTLYEKWSTNSPDTKTAIENFKLDLKQVTIQALQAATDIPQTISDKLKDVDAEKLTNEAADTLLKWITDQINNVNQLATVANSLPLQNIKNLSFDAAAGLIELAGGIDKLTSQISSYYQNYYTADEQRANTLANIRKSLGAVGITEMPQTLADFRRLVESQDLSTEAGRKAYAVLMSLADAFYGVAKASEDAASAAKKEADEKQRAAAAAQAAAQQASKDAAARATDAALAAVQRAVAAEKAVWQAQAQVAQEAINTITSILSTLKTNVDELYNAVATTQVQSQRQALAFIDNALATARSTGYLPDGTQLSDAISAARSGMSDSGNYASLFEQQRAQLILAGKLAELQKIAGTQKTMAEQQLDAANAQLASLDKILTEAQHQVNVLRGIDDSVKSVTAAIATLANAILEEQAANAVANKPGVQVLDPFVVGGSPTGSTAPTGGSSSSGQQTYSGIALLVPPATKTKVIDAGATVEPRYYEPVSSSASSGQNEALLTKLITEVQAMRQSTERTASAIEGNQSAPLLVEIAQ